MKISALDLINNVGTSREVVNKLIEEEYIALLKAMNITDALKESYERIDKKFPDIFESTSTFFAVMTKIICAIVNIISGVKANLVNDEDIKEHGLFVIDIVKNMFLVSLEDKEDIKDLDIRLNEIKEKMKKH